MKAFKKYKSDMGDNYWQKIRSLAEKKDFQLVNKICETCSQLLFNHKPGVCTRSVSAETEYTAEQISEIVSGLSEDVVNTIIENTKTEIQGNSFKSDNFGNSDSLASAFQNLADVLKQQRLPPSQVTKVKIPPVWVKESFTDFKTEVLAWETAHPGDEYTKYCELLNELKRNKVRNGLSDFVSTVVVEKTRNNKTVSGILNLLEDKYELSKKEKFEILVGRIKSFKPSKNDSGEHVLGLLERIERDFENLEVCKNFNYFLAILFLKESFENGVLNEMEKRNIQDLISNKADREIISEIKKEFKKIEIEPKKAKIKKSQKTKNLMK